jgi:hypothetical protein
MNENKRGENLVSIVFHSFEATHATSVTVFLWQCMGPDLISFRTLRVPTIIMYELLVPSSVTADYPLCITLITQSNYRAYMRPTRK